MTRQRIARLTIGAVLTLTAATATAQRLLADFGGPWNVTVQGPQGPMNSLLTLKQSGDTISGDFESELGKAPVAGMVQGDSIKFSFALDVGGQQLSILAAGALKDPKTLNGQLDVGGMGAFPFLATRKE